MADDDKKTNLPDIIPEVDRREVLRGGLATLGRAFMGSLPGAISDLTPADIIPTTKVASPMSITAAFSEFLKRSEELSDSIETLTSEDGVGVADGNAMAEAAGEIIKGEDTRAWKRGVERFYDLSPDDDFQFEGGYLERNSAQRDLEIYLSDLDETRGTLRSAIKELKVAFKEEYPDDFVDWLFDTDKGRNIFSKEITDLQYDLQDAEFTEDGHPLQSWKLPRPEYAGMSEGPDIYRELPREELNEDQRNASDYLTDLFIPNILQKAIPEYEKEKKVKIEDIPWEKIPETKKLPNPVKERVKKVAESTAKEGLGRLLNQLAAKKDTGTKQIEGPKESQSSLNKVLNALSIFRRSSPVGAAASVMWPTPTAHDDDYNFQIPVDR